MSVGWYIDLDALLAAPNCEICDRQTCINYRTCRGELAALVERTCQRAVREPDRKGSRTRPTKRRQQ